MRAPAPGTNPGSAAPLTSVAAVRLPRWAFPLATIVSLLLGATSIVRATRLVVTIQDSDLTNFFLKSADYILRGDPWRMYAVRADLAYPNYNPPLSMFLLAPFLSLARSLGFAANYGEQITFVTLPFILLVPLMGYLALRVMRTLYPEAPETLRLLLYVFITLSPLTWQTYSIWYHVEQPLMLCFLLGAGLALQARREGLAGLLAGLAFLTRTTALIPLIALGVLLLALGAWRALVKFGGVSAVVAAVGFAPFALADPADVKYTFLSWRGGAPIGSDSIWTLFAYTGTSHLRSLINAGAKRLDTYTVLLFVVVVAFLAVRRLRLQLGDRDLWALLALAMLATPMLSKQVWPYYYLEPMLFIAVWELSTLQDRVSGVWRWPVLSISFALVAATLSQYVGVQSVGRLDQIVTGVTQTGLMALFALGVWARMSARKPVIASATGAAPGGMQPVTPAGMRVAGPPDPRGGQTPTARPATYPVPPTPGSAGGPAPAAGPGASWPASPPQRAQPRSMEGSAGYGPTPASPAPTPAGANGGSFAPPPPGSGMGAGPTFGPGMAPGGQAAQAGARPGAGATPPQGMRPTNGGGGAPRRGGNPGPGVPGGPFTPEGNHDAGNPFWPAERVPGQPPRDGRPGGARGPSGQGSAAPEADGQGGAADPRAGWSQRR